jgi:penicillin amidase
MATEYLQRWPMWRPIAESVIRDHQLAAMPPEERSYDVFLLTTLTQAMKSLKIATGEPDQSHWAWGKLHEANFRHVSPNATPLFKWFALDPVPIGGDADTMNSCDVAQDPRALHYNSESGPTQRMIVDMSDRDKFYESLCTGQSGHRFSKYRDDQINAWKRVDLAPIAFSSDQLIRQTRSRLVLENKY